MYSKNNEEQDLGNTNIGQFIRLNNRLRANGFLSIPFLPDIASPARSLILNQEQIGDKSIQINHYKYPNSEGKSEKFIQTGQNSQGLNLILTPEVLPAVSESITPNELELTPDIHKFSNLPQYQTLNTDDFRTIGSIIHDICSDGDASLTKEQILTSEQSNLSNHENKMELPFHAPTNYHGNTSIELSFPPDALKLPPQAISEPQRLIVDGNKLINTIHNLLYELESRGEHTVEAINIERSQKNGLIEKLNLLRKKYDVLEKENESLRAINRSLSDEEFANRKAKTTKDNSLTINKLEREKQQLIVENSRLKQDILKLQEDDDRSRDKADQFLKLLKNNIENEKEINRNNFISNAQKTITPTEKKKLLQSHYLYSVIVGYEKSINYWKSKVNDESANQKNDTYKKPNSEINENKELETLNDKHFFDYCQENNISSSELMKRDKILWSKGLCLLQNTERSELENIIRWSCRLLNTSNFRNIPIFIVTLLSKKNKIKSPRVSHIFESSNPRIVYSNNSPTSNQQDIQNIPNEFYDRFYNHFKTLFDVMDDQDVIQVSNSIYIQLRDLKKFFRMVCNSFNLDDKVTTVSECIKIFNDYFSINANQSKKVPNKQPQILKSPNELYSNNSNAQNIIESLKIVLDVDSDDQILPTLKQHLESQSAIILSLSNN